MECLWVSHVIPYPPKAGVLIRCHHLLRRLAQRHEVDLVAFIQEPYLRTFFPSVEEGLAECVRVLEGLCRSVTLLPIEQLHRPYGKLRTAVRSLVGPQCYSVRWLSSAAARRRITELGETHAYDLAHFDTIGLAQYRERVTAIKSTLGHHNIESHMFLRRAEVASNPLQKAYFWQEGHRLQTYERRMAGRFERHFTCSELDSARLREIVPTAQCVSIPNGVDVEYFTPRGAPHRPDSLIFVGTMNWYPNIDAILFLLREVWPRLLRVRPHATLDIVGAGAPASVMETARGLSGVHLHGYMPDFRPLIDSAALYVCPIRDGGGTKLKILDALSMSKCVLAHPIACEGINVRDGESVRLASTAEQFIDAIVQLLDDEALRRRMGEAARRVALEQYAFDAIGRQFVDELESVARGD